MSPFTAQLGASHHVTCLRRPQRAFGKGGILHLGFRKTGRHIAAFTLEQMCHLFCLKRALETDSLVEPPVDTWGTAASGTDTWRCCVVDFCGFVWNTDVLLHPEPFEVFNHANQFLPSSSAGSRLPAPYGCIWWEHLEESFLLGAGEAETGPLQPSGRAPRHRESPQFSPFHLDFIYKLL